MSAPRTVDQDLYSRQLAVYGQASMAALVQMRVLIVGLRSVGAEAAKNLVLAGLAEVLLYDPSPVTVEDLGYNCFLTPASLGKRRDECSLPTLQELNPKNVLVSILPGVPTPEALVKLSAVVVTCTPRGIMVAWNDACHAAGVPFIAADTAGAAGWAFSDFGAILRSPETGAVLRGHIVRDADGEALRTAVVEGVRTVEGRPNRAIVSTDGNKGHGFVEGDCVAFERVEGFTLLNDGKPRRVCGGASLKAFQFELQLEDETPDENTAHMPPDFAACHSFQGGGGTAAPQSPSSYTGGGIVTLVKVPKYVSHQPLSVRRTAPLPLKAMGMLTWDLGKCGQSEQLHVAFEAVELYRAAHGGSAPPLRDPAAIAECIAHAQAFAGSLGDKLSPHPCASGPPWDTLVNPAIVARVAGLASVELPALGAILGGIVAQEVVKATGKFTPLGQWLYVEGFEAFPVGADPAKLVPEAAAAAVAAAGTDTAAAAAAAASALPTAEFAPNGSRYDGVTAVLGRSLQAAVMSQKVFLVGAGALGCELLKSYALMGVGAGPEGSITVADMGSIAVPNLNNHALFRQRHVGASKAVTAAAAAVDMNPALRVEALNVAVGHDTEAEIDVSLWSGCTLVTNALDSVVARMYVDKQCLWYGKPLLESGTLGTMANVQVVKPHETESYQDSLASQEADALGLKIIVYPRTIEHCIAWAVDLFSSSFGNSVVEAGAFVRDPPGWLASNASTTNKELRRESLESVLAVLCASSACTLGECVQASRMLFNANFESNIQQLLHCFPKDYKDGATGVKFWQGARRAPTPAEFDLSKPLHREFIAHATALIAANFGLTLPEGWDSAESLSQALEGVHVPDFTPKEVRKSQDGVKMKEGSEENEAAIASLVAALDSKVASAGLSSVRTFPAVFEKDNHSNHHLAFLTAAANLRAQNFSLPTATYNKVHMTAGKITPSIATTTCTVSGLVCLELYKLVAGLPVTASRSSWLNLAINSFSCAEPSGPKRIVSVQFDHVLQRPVRAFPEGHSSWDKFVINEGRDLTLSELCAWFKDKHALTVEMVLCNDITLYCPMLRPKQVAERWHVGVHALFEAKRAQKTPQTPPLSRKYLVLDLSVVDDSEVNVQLPTVQYFFKA